MRLLRVGKLRAILKATWQSGKVIPLGTRHAKQMYPLKHLAAKACEKRDLEKWFSACHVHQCSHL